MNIVTDSAADLTAADIAAYGLTVAPLYIQLPEGERRSEELSPDDFYDRLEAMQPAIPTTNQPSPGLFAELYRRAAGPVMSIHISSGLSGTANAARLAATDFAPGEVTVVDTLTLSGGQRFQVLAAAIAARAGWPAAAIVELLGRIQAQTEVIFTLETLSYLARGGRIGRVQALAGAVLNLKPLIDVSHGDGKYNTVGKSRTLPRALADLAEHLAGLYPGGEPLWVSVMHGRLPEQAERLAGLLRERLNIGRLEVLRVSPVLGVHTGPGVVGAAVMPLQLLEEAGQAYQGASSAVLA
ncbi:MAG: DegV family protein [Candidatus Promineofilum sp.]|nr:DegV family protein [Promineifilum sp.]MCW5864465.1 DegV family protein [Anaerolineae bacterium]